jgi:hypothetical protein
LHFKEGHTAHTLKPNIPTSNHKGDCTYTCNKHKEGCGCTYIKHKGGRYTWRRPQLHKRRPLHLEEAAAIVEEAAATLGGGRSNRRLQQEGIHSKTQKVAPTENTLRPQLQQEKINASSQER